MDDLTGFQRDLLYVIAESDQPSGQAVKEEIEQYYNTEVNHGRLYPNLDALVNTELFEKGQRDRLSSYSLISLLAATVVIAVETVTVRSSRCDFASERSLLDLIARKGGKEWL